MSLRWLVLPLLMVWGVLFASTAGAQTYVDVLADQLSSTNHVVVDTNATPKLSGVGELNSQIGNRDVWIINIAAGQTVTPQNLRDALAAKHGGNFSGTIVVISSHGYDVKSFNVSKSVADATNPLFGRARDAHRGDLYGTMSQFVSTLMATPATGPTVVTTAPASKPTNWAFAWGLLWVAVAAGSLVGIWYGFSRYSVRKAERNRLRDQIDRDLITGQRDVDNLSDEVVEGADVSDFFLRASTHLTSARDARHAGNLNFAQAHLDNLHEEVVRAERKLNPTLIPDLEKIDETPEDDRKVTTVSATNPAGKIVSITNNDYRTSPAPGYRNQWAGGMYNGVYFYPGYYPYAYWGPGWGWDPVSVMMMDEMLTDRWGGQYHDTAGYTTPDYSTDFSTPSVSSDEGHYGFDDSSSDTSTPSYSSDDDYTPVSTPSTSSSSSSSSSWDSGGSSFDFGSSSSDSGSSFDFGGGGGSDSSGGSFGF